MGQPFNEIGEWAATKSKVIYMAGKKKTGMLIPHDKYLEAGAHIGTKVKTGPMREFIYMRRNDGLYVLDIQKIDERLRKAAKILANYEPEEILVTASRVYSSIAGANFCNILKGPWLSSGRFIPGTMTNPKKPNFMEPKILLVSDPRGEREAIEEAGKMSVPVIALCDTDNVTRYVDYVIPGNNKGRKSLALMFYLLTREYMMQRGIISSYSEFKYPIKLFANDTALDEIEEQQENYLKTGKRECARDDAIDEEEIESTMNEIKKAQAEADLENEDVPADAEDTVKKQNIPVDKEKTKKKSK